MRVHLKDSKRQVVPGFALRKRFLQRRQQALALGTPLPQLRARVAAVTPAMHRVAAP